MATTTQQELTVLGTRPITADELLEMDARGERGELIRGVFCKTMPTSPGHGFIAMKLGHLLLSALEKVGAGRVMGTDSGVRIEREPDTILAPDIGYYAFDRLPHDSDVSRITDVVPDIVAEVVSPSDTSREVAGKAAMWINAGVRLVWVVWPETKMIEVYRPGQPTVTLRETDTLTGMDVLPQFSTPVGDVFAG